MQTCEVKKNCANKNVHAASKDFHKIKEMNNDQSREMRETPPRAHTLVKSRSFS